MYNVKDIWTSIMTTGKISSPRDQKILEIVYFRERIESPWSNYVGRNFKLDYVKREFQWYLHADPKDLRICQYASTWNKIIQEDGTIFSNYGQYWFPNGFNWVVSTLRKDPDSRQAIIPMLSTNHLFEGNRDVVCSVGPQFRIRNGLLDIHVKFRSSDAIFGLGTDLPTYWWLWEMVACELGIPCGMFVFSADSIHIYERHWEMVRQILDYTVYSGVSYPPITDARDLINGDLQSDFGQWLLEAPL